MSDFHKADGEKVYAAMERDLRTAILNGGLRTDVPIITEGEFEVKYKISRKSVRKAIQNLCDEGLLVKLQGSGTYVVPPEKRAKMTDKKNLRILFLSNQLYSPDVKPSVEYMDALINGMSEFAFRMNWQLNFMRIGDVNFDDIISDYKKSLFDAVIWDCTNSSLKHNLKKIKEHDIPLLTINRSFDNICSICYDHYTEIADTVSFLANLGHKKIAFVNADFTESVYEEREKVFADSLKKFNLKNDFYFKINRRDVINCFEKIFSNKSQPTALILGGHLFLTPFLGWAGTRKLRFPEDVSLICLDDSYTAKSNNPPISVYAEPRSEIGRQALIAIERIINGQMLPGEQIRIKGDLIIRKSCGLPTK